MPVVNRPITHITGHDIEEGIDQFANAGLSASRLAGRIPVAIFGVACQLITPCDARKALFEYGR
jgi:hypothetical protein